MGSELENNLVTDADGFQIQILMQIQIYIRLQPCRRCRRCPPSGPRRPAPTGRPSRPPPHHDSAKEDGDDEGDEDDDYDHGNLLLTTTLQKREDECDEAGEDNSASICAHRNLLLAFLREIWILFPFSPTASTFEKY